MMTHPWCYCGGTSTWLWFDVHRIESRTYSLRRVCPHWLLQALRGWYVREQITVEMSIASVNHSSVVRRIESQTYSLRWHCPHWLLRACFKRLIGQKAHRESKWEKKKSTFDLWGGLYDRQWSLAFLGRWAFLARCVCFFVFFSDLVFGSRSCKSWA